MRLREKREAAADAYSSSGDVEDATPHEEMMLLAASGVIILELNAALGGEQAVQGIAASTLRTERRSRTSARGFVVVAGSACHIAIASSATAPVAP